MPSVISLIFSRNGSVFAVQIRQETEIWVAQLFTEDGQPTGLKAEAAEDLLKELEAEGYGNPLRDLQEYVKIKFLKEHATD